MLQGKNRCNEGLGEGEGGGGGIYTVRVMEGWRIPATFQMKDSGCVNRECHIPSNMAASF